MALKAMIIGPSGTGKTFSLNTLPPAETFVFAPDKKYPQIDAPRQHYRTVMKVPDALQQIMENGWNPDFKINEVLDLRQTNYLPTNNMRVIDRLLRGISANRKDIHFVVIDTITHGMVHSVMSRSDEEGYKKFNIFASEFYNIIDIIPDLREDLFVFFMAHDMVEDNETGRRCMQIPAGKLTQDKIRPEARFDEVLWAGVHATDNAVMYYLNTKNNGLNTCRARVGVFPGAKIPNDALYVAQCIRAYEYGTEKPEPKVITI